MVAFFRGGARCNRARRRAQLARAKPGGGPEVGRRSAYALVRR